MNIALRLVLIITGTCSERPRYSFGLDKMYYLVCLGDFSKSKTFEISSLLQGSQRKKSFADVQAPSVIGGANQTTSALS